jgi:hypothetical protein
MVSTDFDIDKGRYGCHIDARRYSNDCHEADGRSCACASFIRRIRSALAGSPTTGADCGCAA